MRLERPHWGILAGLSLLLATVILVPVSAQIRSIAAAPFDIPPEIAGHEKEWALANHDYANTRAAVDSSINASNVANLKVAWTVDLDGTGEWGGATGSPVISDGTVYFQDLAANTYAVDLKSGNTIWKREYDEQILGPSGPGIGYGKVFVNSRIDRYSGLDIKTGKEVWQYKTGPALHAGAFQPSVFDTRVYVAMQSQPSGQGENVFQSYQGRSGGSVFSLDPETGEPAWQWQSVEEPFWGNPDLNGGGGIWLPPAVDTQHGVSYWGTGNPSPAPGIRNFPNGSSRPGPNLYTDSLVALDHTGKLIWYNQVKPHDLFNLDFQISPVLATVNANGGDQDVVIGSGKLGKVLAFDRQSGKALWTTSIGTHQNDDLSQLPEDETTTMVEPGVWGGVETPMAYADGSLYVLTENLPTPYNATGFDADTPEQAFNRSEGETRLKDGTAEVDALDAATGKILWQHKLDRVAFGAVTVVNDLVFTATLDGTVYALARQDGSIVWQWKGPGGTNAWPAVAGDTIVWAFGIGDGPSMVALSLNGNGSLPTPEQQRTPVRTPEVR